MPVFRVRERSTDPEGGYVSGLSITASTVHQARQVGAEMLNIDEAHVVVEEVTGAGDPGFVPGLISPNPIG